MSSVIGSMASSLQFYIDQHPFPTLLTVAAVLNLLWYYLVVDRRPLVYGGRGGLKDYLLTHCPVLSQSYRPTIWAWHYHGTTIIRALFQQCIPIEFDREIVTLPDGGELALDWSKQKKDDSAMLQHKPVMLIVPGITGDSSLNYVSHFVHDGLYQGYHCVVFNHRGMANMPLKSPRLVAVTNEDIEAVLDVIQTRYPLVPIVAIGVSLGSMILTKYLNSAGSESKINACVAFSACWNIEDTIPTLEGVWINRKVYVETLVDGLKDIVQKNAAIISQNPNVDISRVLRTRRLSDFNKEMTVPTWGFESVQQYHRQCSIDTQLSDIQVPYLAVSSMDDPFAPAHTIPILEFESNPNTVLLLTRHGGHFGFIEGVYPRGRSWMNKIVSQFLVAMKTKQGQQ
ncbi:PREDICTED: phospholipase ABHD3-like [Amphimedon queenslandica]|uniref:AB hydrolase-1 domain-containing protein n=1 Tax=Amphimedon queenslandica TaxID=400682 RepID=A0A1X7V7A4_AMPQE|nr:PREDICTED: phospholipase ABHD3-like [Amphimedon queenslandica]|eukprot:XP_003385407.1 PREDICTED: phospholipase ABHD3-like [Amphimedon queenslandica]